MKSFLRSFKGQARENPDITLLFGIIMAGEVVATTVCLYFASIYRPEMLH
jgi:hypothetical protein